MRKPSNKTLLTALHETRLLITKGWTQHASARAADGSRVMLDSYRAVSFCLLGACAKAVPEWYTRCTLADLIRSNLPKRAGNSLVEFNDSICKTKRPILTLLDKCIKQLEGQAKA